jgi:hypothetical protein
MPSDDEMARIENWLNEEKIPFNRVSNGNTQFHLLITLDNVKLEAFTPKVRPERLIIGGKINVSDLDQQKLASMEEGIKAEFMTGLNIGLLQMQVFVNLVGNPQGSPLEAIITESHAFYDGLDKTTFIDKIFGVKRAVMFTQFAFSRLSGIPGKVTQPAPGSQPQLAGYI